MKKAQVQDEFIRKRMERQKKIRKRRLVFSFCFFTILLVCVGIILSFTVFFPIENLSATGSAIYTEKQILSATNIEKGDNLLSLSENSILNKLKKSLPYIESVKFEKTLPSTLKIKVTDAEEFAAYNKGNLYYTVSESGWTLKKDTQPPENIYVVMGVDVECKVGTQITFKDSEQEHLVKEISKNLSANKLHIDYIDVTDKISILVGVEDRFTVELGSSNYAEEKIKHLAGMVKKIPEESRGKINLSMWTTDNTQGTFKAENAE